MENSRILSRVDESELVVSVNLVEFNNLFEVIVVVNFLLGLCLGLVLRPSLPPALFLPVLQGVLVELVNFPFANKTELHIIVYH